MAESCGRRCARSASDSSSRASFATVRTSSRDRDMGDTRRAAGGSDGRHAERLPLDRPLNLPAPDALDADPGAGGLAVLDHLHALKVRLELPPADAGNLLAHPAEVLGFPAVGLLI